MKIFIPLLLLISLNAFADDFISLNYIKNSTVEIEEALISVQISENSSNKHTYTDRMIVLKNENIREKNQKIQVNIPLIWYVEDF